MTPESPKRKTHGGTWDARFRQYRGEIAKVDADALVLELRRQRKARERVARENKARRP